MAESSTPNRESTSHNMAESISIAIPDEEIMAQESSSKITPKLGGIGFRTRKDVSNGDGAENMSNVEEAKKILKKYAEACDQELIPKCARLLQNLGLATWAFLGLVLGGFGTYLSAPVFWVCLVILFCDALARYISRPRGSVIFEGRSKDMWVSTSPGVFKLLPILALLALLRRTTTFTTSDQCKQGSVCYSRLTESLWAIVGTSLAEILPTMFILGILLVNHTAEYLWHILSTLKSFYFLFTKLAFRSKAMYLQITARPESEKLQGIQEQFKGPRRREIHILLSTLGDLKSDSFLGTPSIRGSHPTDDQEDIDEPTSTLQMVASFSWLQSAVSVILILTVGLLVGGSFGTFMTRKAYWICYCSVFVELLVESSFGERMKSTELSGGRDEESNAKVYDSCWEKLKGSRKPFVLSSILRFCAQGPLFGVMVFLIHTGDYFSLDSSGGGCDTTCQNRGRELFYIACISAGLQGLTYPAYFITWPIMGVVQVLGMFVAALGSVVLVFVVYFLALLVVPFLALISLLLYLGVCFIIILVGALVDRITGKSFCGTCLGLRAKS